VKIVSPEVQISNDTGFDPAIDIFRRKDFGERLANLIENADGNVVIALDAGWGQGKSTFIKMWRGYLSHHRDPIIQSVYFDAFENDYQKDPFLALASEMYQLIPDAETSNKTKFKDKAIKAGKSLARGALKLTVKTVTAGIVDDSTFGAAESGISSLIADQVDDLVKEKFEHAQKDKLALKEFKKHLSEFAKNVGNDKPIVFIIDELDRCRPDFALELLEQVKHLFSVEGITFLLVTNRVQLEQSIMAKYGGIDPVNYLHKFINVWLTMPRSSEEHNDNGYQYLRHLMQSMLVDSNQKTNLKDCENVLYEIVQYYQPSFREIDRMLSYFSILSNMTSQQSYGSEFQLVMAMVCYLKVCKPYALIPVNGTLSYDQIANAANFADIEKTDRFSQLEHITRLIKFDFGDQELKDKMIEEKLIHQPSYMRQVPNRLIAVNKWLTEITN
jgi:dsRNA-specific ribonuclease